MVKKTKLTYTHKTVLSFKTFYRFLIEIGEFQLKVWYMDVGILITFNNQFSKY